MKHNWKMKLSSSFASLAHLMPRVVKFLTLFNIFSECCDSLCRNISSAKYGAILAFCVKLTLWMQIISFCVRSLSSLLWIQMYRLGAAVLETTDIQETYNLNLNLKSNSMDSISSEPSGSGFCSTFNAAYNGPVDDPSQYRSLFEDAQDQRYIEKVIFFLF